MTKNKVKISLDLQGRYKHIVPEISISVDDSIIAHRRLDQIDRFLIDVDLSPGYHRLCIDLDDPAALAQDPDIGIEIKSLKFQNLSDEFSIYSLYKPIYPEHWIKENLAKGHVLDPIIHSNYIGWCGQWWISFETPIYQWIHKRLNLGWLLDSSIKHADHDTQSFHEHINFYDRIF
jgi:hypothetical protein